MERVKMSSGLAVLELGRVRETLAISWICGIGCVFVKLIR
jgi:hypothetical protein